MPNYHYICEFCGDHLADTTKPVCEYCRKMGRRHVERAPYPYWSNRQRKYTGRFARSPLAPSFGRKMKEWEQETLIEREKIYGWVAKKN